MRDLSRLEFRFGNHGYHVEVDNDWNHDGAKEMNISLCFQATKVAGARSPRSHRSRLFVYGL